MKIIEEILAMFPDTTAEEWHKYSFGGGWVHKDAYVESEVYISDAVIRGGIYHGGHFFGGNFLGGYFRGGNFHDGNFHDGDFYGGTFYDGTFYRGKFYSGDFYDGTFCDGIFHGGYFRDGDFYGGNFLDGNYLGGSFDGGTWRSSPAQMVGRRWTTNQCDVDKIKCGCEIHTFDEWLNPEFMEEIFTEKQLTDDEKEEYRAHILHCIAMAKFVDVK